jgi:hypothetical protein
MHRTFQEIADTLHYRSRKSAQDAVRAHMARMPKEDLAVQRALTAGSYEIVIARLHRLLATAEKADDRTGAATVARALADVQEKHAKLTGQYAEAKPDVEVTVNVGLTPASVLKEAESNLIAIAAARRASMPAIAPPVEIVDAEVVAQ